MIRLYQEQLLQLQLSPEGVVGLRDTLAAITSEGHQYIQCEQTAQRVRDFLGEECKVGSKASRLVNRVCKKCGLSEHVDYNARFAKLADALNPLSVPRTAILSVHPCDYLEMSGVRNSWSSCHSLEGGVYRGGTLSYLGDGVTMIFYTVDRTGDTYELFRRPKVTREVFCYGAGILLQSRLYPDMRDLDTMTDYRNLVQRIITTCLGVPNLWLRKTSLADIHDYIRTGAYALQYADYDYECYSPSVSLLYPDTTDSLEVGTDAPCIVCGGRVAQAAEVLCDDCLDTVQCHACGSYLCGDDAVFVDDEFYCAECVDYCEVCSGAEVNGLTSVNCGTSSYRLVCHACLEDTDCCDVCGSRWFDDSLKWVDDKLLCPRCASELEEAV